MSLGTWASPTRPEASTGRAWPDPIRTGPKRVRAGSVPGGPFGHLYMKHRVTLQTKHTISGYDALPFVVADNLRGEVPNFLFAICNDQITN
jgi:hypothetical protein